MTFNNKTTMLKKINVGIDANVVIQCPAKDFKLRRAANSCPGCECFKGIGLMSEADDLAWHQKFVIRCGHVMERRTQLIEVIED